MSQIPTGSLHWQTRSVPVGMQELEQFRREQSSHVSDMDRVPETIVDALEEDLGWRDRQAMNPSPRRRRRIRGSDLGPSVHDLTLIDSSDVDAPFVVPRRSAASVERGWFSSTKRLPRELWFMEMTSRSRVLIWNW